MGSRLTCVFLAFSIFLGGLLADSAKAESGPPPVVNLPPPPKMTLIAGPYDVSGTYHSKVGINTIYCGVAPTRAGDFDWTVATIDSDKTWTALIDLPSGANVVAFYGVDSLGQTSKTNYVNVTAKEYLYGPLTLDGTETEMVMSNGVQYELSFGAGTFVQQSSDTNYPSGVGNYTYTVTGSNTAQLFLGYISPAEMAGVTNVLDITFPTGEFTEPFTVTFTTSSGDGGAMESAFPAATNLAPSSIAGLTVELGDSTTVAYTDGEFTYISPTETNTGIYTYNKFSPCGGLIKMRQAFVSTGSESNDVVLRFSSAEAGTYFSSAYDSNGVTVSAGGFTSASKHKEGGQNAPASLAGLQIRLTPVSELSPLSVKPYTVDFGEATLGITSSANQLTGVGNYTYLRSGAESAQVSFTYVYPQFQAGSGGVWDLLFTSSHGGSFFNTNGFEAGTFTVTATKNLLPATVDGRTVLLAEGAPFIASFSQGMFTLSSDFPPEITLPVTGSSGTYSFFPAGNHVAMGMLNETNSLPVLPEFLQLDFLTPTSGVLLHYYIEGIDEFKTVGTFKLK